MTGRQRLAVLGATGSVGASTLDVIARHPDRYRVFALTANQRRNPRNASVSKRSRLVSWKERVTPRFSPPMTRKSGPLRSISSIGRPSSAATATRSPRRRSASAAASGDSASAVGMNSVAPAEARTAVPADSQLRGRTTSPSMPAA